MSLPQTKLQRAQKKSSVLSYQMAKNYAEQAKYKGAIAGPNATAHLYMSGHVALAHPFSAADIHLALTVQPLMPLDPRSYFRAVAGKLREKHPGISTNPKVLGGAPHIEGLRVSVHHVLTHLYHLGSVDAVVGEFKNRLSKEQVKQALAYAHDFMEMACDPSEDVD